jgi:hypothetical protein
MRLRNRQRADLVSLLQHRLDSAPADVRDWLTGVEVACAVQDMDAALQRAGLDGGVEPTVRSM